MDPTVTNLGLLPSHLPALEDRAGVWTRGELRGAVDRAHTYFRLNQIGPEDRIAVLTGADKRLIAVLLGARSAGAMVCPVDPKESSQTLANLKPRMVVSALPTPSANVVDVGVPLAGTGVQRCDVTSAENAWGVATSGSSGSKSTVILTETSVAHVTQVIQDIVGYRSADRIHGGLPLHHTYGLSQLWLAMTSGACLILPTGYPTQHNLTSWLGGATVFPTIASRLRLLYQLGFRPNQRLITLAGQDVDAGTRKMFSQYAGDTRFFFFYGLTEATTRVLWLGNDEFFNNPRATGRPIRGVRAWLDEEDEMWVDGPNVAAGYLDDPEATARRFSGGKLRTGDCFEFDGDLFYFRGRIDGIFKRYGEKIIPETVESTLESHPNVAQCLITPDPDAAPGAEPAPVAWIVARGDVPDRWALVRYARERVPAVMVPVKIHFVSSLATTSNGKLIRKSLRTG